MAGDILSESKKIPLIKLWFWWCESELLDINIEISLWKKNKVGTFILYDTKK